MVLVQSVRLLVAMVPVDVMVHTMLLVLVLDRSHRVLVDHLGPAASEESACARIAFFYNLLMVCLLLCIRTLIHWLPFVKRSLVCILFDSLVLLLPSMVPLWYCVK